MSKPGAKPPYPGARAFDDDPRLAALFTAPPGARWDMGMRSKLFPASAGFAAADVPRLAALASLEVPAHAPAAQFAPVHALHALIRLGAAAAPAAPALVARCLRLRFEDDFCAEFFSPTPSASRLLRVARQRRRPSPPPCVARRRAATFGATTRPPTLASRHWWRRSPPSPWLVAT